MGSLSVDEVIERADSADKIKQNWVSQYRDAYEFAIPMRNLYETVQPGAEKMNRVFNSTAINSTQKFASRLQSNLTPPFQHWLDFIPGTDFNIDSDSTPAQIAEKDEAAKVLQDIQKIFFGVLQNSNFDIAITEFYLDLAVGTGVMLVTEGDDDNPVVFTAVPNAQVSMDEGPLGSVDGVFRQHNMAVRNIESTWKDLTPEGKAQIKKT